MDFKKLASSLLVVGFDGQKPTPEARELIAQGVTGAILFKRNVGEASQTAGLCAELKQEARRPFLLCVDQEGGRVARLRGGCFTEVPPMRSIGSRSDEALAQDVGRLLAREVRAAGFDVDFAPVLDVDTNPANPVIGDRSLAREAEAVARLGVAVAKGIESESVASCGKHFPGHGDTAQDSHLTLPRLPHDMKRLREVELVPFAAYAKARLASIMTAHVVFEALDPEIPATFSSKVLTDLLRKELHFEGVIISDDLEMKAVADRYDMGEAAVRSVLAGVDLLLVCHKPDRQQKAIDGLAHEAEKSQAFRRRLEDAARRVEDLRARFAAPPRPVAEALAVLETPEHRALGLRVRNAGALTTGADPTAAASRTS
ncbi:MAG TPA: beta-N-acetylhexosaminidase [Myxococcales bacterium]|jgi:beta-N-acetylhexosaminidase